jgi:hypothetical protein
MPILNVFEKKVILPNYDYSEKYWPIVSEIVFAEIGETELKEPTQVQDLLKKCFAKLCAILEQKISEQKKASFYIFCQYLHEDSIEIWEEQINGNELGDIEEDFAASRRILKIILEQSCKINLVGTPNFYNEIQANIDSYTEYLEELLYIGSWCYILSEFISRSQLFPSSIGLKYEDGRLSILPYQPFSELFKFVFEEKDKHNSDIELSDSIHGFIKLLKDEFSVDYNNLSSFVNRQIENPIYRFGLNNINSIIEELHSELKYDKKFSTIFYNGLKINKYNCLSIEDCFLKNQHENRHVFRPILELFIDGETYHMIGRNKWSESLTLLSTNSFPFGHFPTEWTVYRSIKDFVNEIDNTHDKILEDPIKDLLKKANRIFDYNIESFSQPKTNNINIKNTVGDIDILFLDEKYKIIYVCECKHNRSRFDLNNWKRDYSNFKSKYENQLERKTNWVKDNTVVLENHLKLKYPERTDLDISQFETRGIFIINAPTIYMFNGKYRAFTITDIKDLLNEQYVDITFKFTYESSGKTIFVEYPYFDNLEKRLKE